MGAPAYTLEPQPGGGFLARGAPDPNRTAKKERFLDALSELGHVEEARKAAGIGHGTLWEWIDADEEFKRAYHDRLRGLEGNVAGSLYRRAVSETVDPRAANVAAMMWGKRFFPDLYLEQRQAATAVNVTISPTVLVQVLDQAGVTRQLRAPVTIDALPAPESVPDNG